MSADDASDSASQGGQFLQRNVEPPNLDVPPEAYFGEHPDALHNAEIYGIRRDPSEPQELYRVSYLYLLVFDSDYGTEEYGGMQLRAETHLWLNEGQVTTDLQKIIQRTAHKAAHIYDSSIETSAYGPNDWADGYLRGFDPWENGENYDNWEIEPVARDEVHNPPGVIDWTTEIYIDVDGLKYANLSGVATGLANPWDTIERHEPGREPIHIAPHKWEIDAYPSRPDYYELRAPKRTDARTRYRDGAGAGKDVYINEKRVGEIDHQGRAWLKKEYVAGNTNRGGDRWSREGLVDETGATWQALAKGGTLYMTGETRDGVYLTTRRERPDNWSGANPDDVSIHLTADEGRPERTYYLLDLDNPADPLEVHAREDRQVEQHMGYSHPPYSHAITEMFRHPGFRPIEPYHVNTRDDRGDDPGQAGLSDYGGGGQ